MICAIHQPNFFPWYGYFNKIANCDIFVFLDDTQVVKKGASYCNRVAFNMGGIGKNFTAPITRDSGLQNIKDVMFENLRWRDKLKKTLQMNYSKSAFYKDCIGTVMEIIDYDTNFLSEYNTNAIKKISSLLGIDIGNKFVTSSTININSTSTKRLVEICKATNCKSYIYGDGALNYQNDDLFFKNGIELIKNNFQIKEYSQPKTDKFINGLSILDMLFNIGFKESAKIVSQNCLKKGID